MVLNSMEATTVIKSIHLLAKFLSTATPISSNNLPVTMARNDVVLRAAKKSLLLPRCSTRPGLDNVDTTRNPVVEPDRTGSAPHLASSPWALSSKRAGLVLDTGLPDPDSSWDGLEVGSPVVKRYVGDDEERWYMWYHGSSSSDPGGSIGLATSSNGVCWARGAGAVVSSRSGVGRVLCRRDDWWAFDTWSVRPSEIVIMSSPMYSGVYWMYYTGYTQEEVEFNGRAFKRALPGLACSQDGRNWARIEGDYHTGSLLDFGSGNEWDSLLISSPKVVAHATGDMRMYYHSPDPTTGKFWVGLARSRDGIRWVKLGKIEITPSSSSSSSLSLFDEAGIKNVQVVRRRSDGKYLMAYEGVSQSGARSIGMAVSEDGLKRWTRVGDEAVLGAAEGGAWDNGGVGSPCMVEMEGEDRWRLYYKGVGEKGKTGIGMAVSNGSDVSRFRRWDCICKLAS